ncbi:MAG: AGE family epimerase/isomerase, partial [Candidatus Sumerlaeaceae bacterium]|nr:AGE family epimerase/isomerase [Candidatus Sumerlaeaceae bacterium]
MVGKDFVRTTLVDRAERLAKFYRTALVENVIPFWCKHSPDKEFGGYFTCLDRSGNVYDTDKFTWLQARQVWTFSMLYNRLEPDAQWLQMAKLGADFLARHVRDAEGNWYFSLTRDGRPLVQPYNIFSECFGAMAFAQYALATGSDEAATIARQAWEVIQRRRENPKGRWSKIVPGTRPMVSCTLTMILSNLVLEMEHLLEGTAVEQTIEQCVATVMGRFVDEETGLMYEHIAPDNSHPDTFEGRLLIPGHALEAMWFMMAIGERRNDVALIEKAIRVALQTLEFGWDKDYDGLFYFMDARGKPLLQLEWDQKLWWVHAEALVALAKAIRLAPTKELRKSAWEWYKRVHDYTWSRFPDPEFGEWFGYLHRDGGHVNMIKGGKWKGCYHI